MTGHVTFVGAGPGDPTWLTLDGQAALRRADVIVTDALVHPGLLAEARWDARIVAAGKRAEGHSTPQMQIHEAMLAGARAGLDVVRLKGGDPGIFGRLAEEISALDTAGVPWRIVPGITAAQAAVARLGTPLTDREHAASVTLLTGHRRASGRHPEMDWAAAARSGTVVVYMGVLEVGRNVERLVASGMAPETPVAVVRWASTPAEQVWQTDLAGLPDLMSREDIRPPALWIVGETVAGLRPERVPPSRLLVSFRPEMPADWPTLWRDRGWQTMHLPLQRIVPLPDKAVFEPTAGDWLVFASPTAVRSAWPLVAAHDLRRLADVRVAVVGAGTAAVLAASGLTADLVVVGHRGADELPEPLCDAAAATVWWFGAADGRPEPMAALRAAGVDVRPIVSHAKIARPLPLPALDHALSGDWLSAAVWTASSQVDLLAGLYPPERWGQIGHVAIGGQTGDRLSAAGFPRVQVAELPTAEGIAAALEALC